MDSTDDDTLLTFECIEESGWCSCQVWAKRSLLAQRYTEQFSFTRNFSLFDADGFGHSQESGHPFHPFGERDIERKSRPGYTPITDGKELLQQADDAVVVAGEQSHEIPEQQQERSSVPTRISKGLVVGEIERNLFTL